MESVGIRELRDTLSAKLRRVRAGETIAVTDHGAAIAYLVPATEPEDVLARLVREGKVSPATESYSPPKTKVRLKPGCPLEDYIREERDEGW